METEELIRIEHVSKSFPGVQALKDINISIKKGTIHGLVGENGAGKSTLIKILMGVHTNEYEGEIYIDGEKALIDGPIRSKKLGLQAIYQDITLSTHLSVGENFFIGKMPKKHGIIDWEKVYSVSQGILDDLGIKINARSRVSDLTVAQQEMATIAKALSEKARLVVFDEPTALLTKEDTKLLFSIIRRMKADGVSIIYITHRMEEIFEICDEVSILKDGEYVATVNAKDVDEASLVSMMVGRNVSDMYSIEHGEQGEVSLEVKNFSRGKAFQDINFSVRKGQILGFYGLVGSGRTEVMRCIFGADKLDSGEIYIDGEKVEINSPSDAIKHGIGFLPEDRKKQGLCLGLDIVLNVNLSSYSAISKAGLINIKKEEERGKKYIDQIGVKTPSPKQRVVNLSGGNQQKVVIGKWLCRGSEILIFDEPTVGIDVNAKREIYRLLEQLSKEQKTIIFVSSYLPELFGIADEIIVFSEGRQMGMITKDDRANMTSRELEEYAVMLASGIAANKSNNGAEN